jgi:hypothetical protein
MDRNVKIKENKEQKKGNEEERNNEDKERTSALLSKHCNVAKLFIWIIST